MLTFLRGAAVAATLFLVPAASLSSAPTQAVLQPAVLTLQKAVTAGASFDATVSCESDGNADIVGKTSIIAVRVD